VVLVAPPLALDIDTRASTNLNIKHEEQDNIFAIFLLNGKDATIF